MCGVPGSVVELLTVKALATEAALRRLTATRHRFCATPTCVVVYFNDAGRTLSAADLRVPVWQKQPFGARTLCYCFGESEAVIRQELQEHGRTDVVERIRSDIAACRCACEVRNPRGACCLGDVIAAVTRVTKARLVGSD